MFRAEDDDLLKSIIDGDATVRANIEKSASASKDQKKSHAGLDYIELQETTSSASKEKSSSKQKPSSAISKEKPKSPPKAANVNLVDSDNNSELKEEKSIKPKLIIKTKKKAKKYKDSDYDSDPESGICGCSFFSRKKKSDISKKQISENGNYVPPQVKGMSSPTSS